MALTVDIEKKLGDFQLAVAFSVGDHVHGLLGASGCGKSMTLRCIAGITRPDRGRIELNGRVLFDSERGIDVAPQERRVGLLFQSYALFPNMTVEQNLKAASSRQSKKAINDMISRFRLEGLEKLRPHQLSGGQQQRVALARILLTEPEILMLDEPFSALDSYLRWQTELEVDELLEGFEGTTLIVSHDKGEIRRLCCTATAMEKGRAMGAVTVEELFAAPKNLAECLLTGCKNYSRAEVTGDKTVMALDWGMELVCETSVSDDTCYVALHSGDVRLADTESENACLCRVARIIRDVGNTVVMLSMPSGGTLRMELEDFDQNVLAVSDEVYVSLPKYRLMLLK